MERKHEFSYRCVICEKNEIVFSCIEETYEGPPLDQQNCDLSSYRDHKVVGGKLFSGRSRGSSYYYFQAKKEQGGKSPFGGICEGCLQKDGIKVLVNPIRFED